MDVPVLRTPRLSLEPFSECHSAGMFELWSSAEVCLHSGPAADIHGRPIRLPALEPLDSDKILQFFIERQRLGTGLRWAVVIPEPRTFIGAMGFNSLGSCCEIAYHQRPEFWGNGYMVEACRAAIDWAMDAVNATAIEAFIEPENLGSNALARRLGLSRTGEIEQGAYRYLVQTARS